jgi:hypothetical protein
MGLSNFSLPSLDQLQSVSQVPFSQIPASDPASPFFVPPAGMMQNDAGQVVPVGASTPSTPSSSDMSLSDFNPLTTIYTGLIKPVTDSFSNTGKQILGIDLEDVIFIVLGLLLIAAGLFAFKGTQTIIQKGANIASKVGKASAEVAA